MNQYQNQHQTGIGGGMTNPAVPAPKRIPQSEQTIGRLESTLETTAKLVNGLESKLIPILSGPRIEEKCAGKDKPNLASLFERINNCADQVASLNSNLNELIDRVEL